MHMIMNVTKEIPADTIRPGMHVIAGDGREIVVDTVQLTDEGVAAGGLPVGREEGRSVFVRAAAGGVFTVTPPDPAATLIGFAVETKGRKQKHPTMTIVSWPLPGGWSATMSVAGTVPDPEPVPDPGDGENDDGG